MSEWQPIETAPKDGTHILIVRAGEDKESIEITFWYQNFQDEYVPDKDGLYRKETILWIESWNGNGHRATHWMPLPEPPVEEEKKR